MGFTATQFLWEVYRFSWLLVFAAAAFVFCRERAAPPAQRNRPAMWFASLIFPTLLLVAQWSHCRIAAGALSRVGAESYVAVVFLLPALFLTGRRADVPPVVAAVLVLAVSLMNPNHLALTFPESAAAKPFARRLPPNIELMDGAALGMPKLGRLLPAPEMAELMELKQALHEWLKPGETFLDFTNKSAFYFYLNLPVPAAYSSTYVAGNTSCQGRILRQLDVNTPPVVLIAPGINHDNIPASLRSYHLYREFVLRYQPVRRGSLTFLVDPARLPEKLMPLRERLGLLNAVFRPSNLHRLPAAWANPGQRWQPASTP